MQQPRKWKLLIKLWWILFSRSFLQPLYVVVNYTNAPRLYRILFIILIHLCIHYADGCCINVQIEYIFQQHNWHNYAWFFGFTMITKTRPWRETYTTTSGFQDQKTTKSRLQDQKTTKSIFQDQKATTSSFCGILTIMPLDMKLTSVQISFRSNWPKWNFKPQWVFYVNSNCPQQN